MNKKLGDVAFVTKLAGFEHTSFIQGNCSHSKVDENYIPLFIGRTVKNGRIDKNFDWYINREISEKLPRSKLEKKCIILPYVGTIGDLAIYDGSYSAHLGSNIAKIELNNNNEYIEEFIYYFLKSTNGQKLLLKDIQGAVQKNITMKAIRNIELPKISIERQNDLISILQLIDKKIEINNSINIELESIVKDIYNYWFLQYEFPNKEGKYYKSSGGKMIWNEELNKEIPAGWKTITLSEIIKNDKGGDWGKDKKEGNYICNIKCIRGADLPGLLGKEQLNAPQRYILEKNSYKKLEQGDLIIEISGGSPTQSTGRIGYINQNTLKRFDTDLITSNFCKAISLENKNMQYWFYMLWQQLYDNNILFKYEGKTTGIKNLLFDMLCKDYLIVLPDIEILKKFNDSVSILFETIQKNCKENETLSNLRDFLLPLLMSGQVGFKD